MSARNLASSAARGTPLAIPVIVLVGLLVLLTDEFGSLWRIKYWVAQSIGWITLVVASGMALSLFVTKGVQRTVALILGAFTIVILFRAYGLLLPW